ncbi:peptidase family C54 [Ostertagia ostertagi]
MVDSYLTFEPSFWELLDNTLFESTDQVVVLGKQFNKRAGGTGPETDQGWGCMLRCAQMLLGEVLLRRHIGRDFEWKEGVPPSGSCIAEVPKQREPPTPQATARHLALTYFLSKRSSQAVIKVMPLCWRLEMVKLDTKRFYYNGDNYGLIRRREDYTDSSENEADAL